MGGNTAVGAYRNRLGGPRPGSSEARPNRSADTSGVPTAPANTGQATGSAQAAALNTGSMVSQTGHCACTVGASCALCVA